MRSLKSYIALACITAGAGCLIIGMLLVVKAFFVDSLSSYGYGIFGLFVLGVAGILIVLGRSLSKSKE